MTKKEDKTVALKKLKRAVASVCSKDPALKGKRPVFGEGNIDSAVAVVGEAPGRTETELGRPFVGRAGRFFVKVMEETLGKKREDVYMTNVVKVWPTVATKRLRTRPPGRKEVELFAPFLEREMAIISPKVVVAVGRTAFTAVTGSKDFIPGRWHRSGSCLVMPVYHPAYILRMGNRLKDNTEGLKKALRKVRGKIRQAHSG